MQATSLTFVIVAAQIGTTSGQISQTTAATLLAAGLLSAALFPAAALKLLTAGTPGAETPSLPQRRYDHPDPHARGRGRPVALGTAAHSDSTATGTISLGTRSPTVPRPPAYRDLRADPASQNPWAPPGTG
jgi:hypothetical protein